MFDQRYLAGWENAKTNGLGTNEKIEFHAEDEAKLRDFGFHLFEGLFDIPPHWHWHRSLTTSVSLDVNYYVRPYKGAQVEIITIDEDCCQPYDYQYLLKRNPKMQYALTVFDRVEAYMRLLSEAGIVSGHEYGDYI